MDLSPVPAWGVLQRVPLRDSRETPVCRGAPAASLPSLLPPLRALVVDDDRDLRELLADLIALQAFSTPDGVRLSIDQAANGRDALAKVRADPQARWLILLDLRMP